MELDRNVPFIGEFGDYGTFGGYAFISKTPRAGLWPMRFGFRESTAGMSPNRLITLGLWVKPKPEALDWFRNARSNRGLLWSG